MNFEGCCLQLLRKTKPNIKGYSVDSIWNWTTWFIYLNLLFRSTYLYSIKFCSLKFAFVIWDWLDCFVPAKNTIPIHCASQLHSDIGAFLHSLCMLELKRMIHQYHIYLDLEIPKDLRNIWIFFSVFGVPELRSLNFKHVK